MEPEELLVRYLVLQPGGISWLQGINGTTPDMRNGEMTVRPIEYLSLRKGDPSGSCGGFLSMAANPDHMNRLDGATGIIRWEGGPSPGPEATPK